MKKIIASFVLFVISASQALAFDASFLDQMQRDNFENKSLTEWDAQRLLEMSPEATSATVVISVPAVETMEEAAPIQYAEKAPRSIKRYSTVRAYDHLPEYLELIDREEADSSLELVKKRQNRAQAKLARYRALFR